MLLGLLAAAHPVPCWGPGGGAPGRAEVGLGRWVLGSLGRRPCTVVCFVFHPLTPVAPSLASLGHSFVCCWQSKTNRCLSGIQTGERRHPSSFRLCSQRTEAFFSGGSQDCSLGVLGSVLLLTVQLPARHSGRSESRSLKMNEAPSPASNEDKGSQPRREKRVGFPEEMA